MKRNDDWFSPMATWLFGIFSNVCILIVAAAIVGLLFCLLVDMGVIA